MLKERIRKELEQAIDHLKDYKRFIHLFSDKPKGTLTRLYQTILNLKLLMDMNGDIKDVCHPTKKAVRSSTLARTGLVKIRPVNEEYEKKTYLGFCIGEAATGSAIKVEDNKIQLEFSGYNPAVYVPELGKVIYGYESWWEPIEDEKDFNDITNSDIENVWYVKLWKTLNKEN